ncbi:hypothetical protein QN397_08535 [Variovorax sp. RTB1]|uniref:hypothetical protein n=1 Tax=Variovorax sp. RTB1 TaxID=3048631 RepID=UPI002B22305D|nr:hypothetical protein [Variovorax sp. RTB1]MEB0111396.1 hypothetical protein [Variovorax sp. RTB1]
MDRSTVRHPVQQQRAAVPRHASSVLAILTPWLQHRVGPHRPNRRRLHVASWSLPHLLHPPRHHPSRLARLQQPQPLLLLMQNLPRALARACNSTRWSQQRHATRA